VTINLQDYIAGGFYITHYMSRPAWMQADLIPDEYLSLSGCISDRLPVASSWLTDVPDEAKNLGMTPDLWESFKEWSNDNLGKQFGYPDTFYTLEAARRILKHYFPIPNQLMIMGIGLHKSRVQAFLTQHQDSGDYYGVYKVLSQLHVLREGALIKGLEVLGYGNGINHSWLCYNMEWQCHQKLGIAPNDAGLLGESDADAVNAYVNENEGGWSWQPWLVVQYPSD